MIPLWHGWVIYSMKPINYQDEGRVNLSSFYKKRTMKILLLVIIIPIILIAYSCPNSPKVLEEPNLKILWQSPIALVDIPNSEILVIDNETLVYSGEAELLTAISTEDGSLIWQSDRYDGRALRAEELLVSRLHNTIYGRHFNNIITWRANTGQIIYELSDSLDGISVSRVGFNTLTEDGYAVIGENTDLHILDWDGKLKYNVNVPWTSKAVTYDGSRLFLGQRNTVHGGLTQGRIRAFDAATGDSIWTYQTDNGGFHTRLYVLDGLVFGAAKGNSPLGEIVALNKTSGKTVWVFNEKDKAQTQNLAISDSKIYANTGGGITALNLENGVLEWRVDWMGFDSNKPTYNSGYVYHVRSSELLIINDDTGEIVHREPVPKDNGNFWHVISTDNALIVQTSSQIIAYEPWHLRKN